jgi:hypothetical protein
MIKRNGRPRGKLMTLHTYDTHAIVSSKNLNQLDVCHTKMSECIGTNHVTYVLILKY